MNSRPVVSSQRRRKAGRSRRVRRRPATRTRTNQWTTPMAMSRTPRKRIRPVVEPPSPTNCGRRLRKKGELRQEAEEEDRRLRVQQVGEQPLAEAGTAAACRGAGPPADGRACRCAALRLGLRPALASGGAVSGTATRGEHRPHAEMDEVGRAAELDAVVPGGGVGRDDGEPRDSGEHVHAQPGLGAQRRRASQRGVLGGRPHDDEEVRAGDHVGHQHHGQESDQVDGHVSLPSAGEGACGLRACGRAGERADGRAACGLTDERACGLMDGRGG